MLIPCWLLAQTAEDYFHGAAQFYVFGQKQRAMTEVATGLSRFPNDPKLNGLAGFIKKKEEDFKKIYIVLRRKRKPAITKGLAEGISLKKLQQKTF